MMRKVVMAALAAWLVPAASFAQAPVASAVMYEVNETLRFVKGKGHRQPTADEMACRLARASLLGRALKTERPHDLFRGDFVQADATSNVDLRTGKGPIIGKLNMLVDLDPNRESLDTLVVTTELRIRGELDLTTAAKGFAAMTGEWRATLRPKQAGTFQGLFLIPFQVPGDERYFYLDLGLEGPGTLCASQAGICPLEDDEFSLGIPLTKAVVTFFQ